MRKPLSEAQREEMSADTRAFVGSKSFNLIFDDLEQTYVDQLKSSNVGDLAAGTAHASLRTLEDVKAAIRQYSEKRMR